MFLCVLPCFIGWLTDSRSPCGHVEVGSGEEQDAVLSRQVCVAVSCYVRMAVCGHMHAKMEG